MYVYILSDEKNSVVKVGVTSRKVFERVKDINNEQRRYKFVVFGARAFTTHVARSVEKKLLNILSNIGKPVEFYFGGCTECFVVPDVSIAESTLWSLLDSYSEEKSPVKLAKKGERSIPDLHVDLTILDKFPLISLTDLLVLSMITLDTTISIPNIATNLNISSKTVERSLQKLCDIGIIGVTKITISGCIVRNQYKIQGEAGEK